MPLEKSGSKEAVSRNISEMRKSGYPEKQAVAASYRNQRKYGKKGKRGKRHHKRTHHKHGRKS